MRNAEPIEVEGVVCIRETDAALLCQVDGKEVWIPRSQVLDDSEVNEEGDEGVLVIPEWLALERGLA